MIRVEVGRPIPASEVVNHVVISVLEKLNNLKAKNRVPKRRYTPASISPWEVTDLKSWQLKLETKRRGAIPVDPEESLTIFSL